MAAAGRWAVRFGDNACQDFTGAIHVKGIRIASPGHQGGAQTVDGPHDRDAAPAAHRIGAKGNAGHVRTHQPFDEHGGRPGRSTGGVRGDRPECVR